jgi:hypothetical protein
MSSLETACMTIEEVGALLNTLLEAERAGAAVLTAFVHQVELGPRARAEMRRIQRDESHNCGVLIRLLDTLGIERSRVTGDFLYKALAVKGAVPRLQFLNRGQAWVERRIAEALPLITDEQVRRALEAMRISHAANIAACEALVADAPASGATSNEA